MGSRVQTPEQNFQRLRRVEVQGSTPKTQGHREMSLILEYPRGSHTLLNVKKVNVAVVEACSYQEPRGRAEKRKP